MYSCILSKYVSKVTEKACLRQFEDHMDNNHLRPDYQSAYRKGYSTETALLKLTNDILRKMDKQSIVVLCAMDLSAAFDTVDHDILLSVLNRTFNVDDTALQWFNSYLRPRALKVNVNDIYSSVRDLHFSVPQGSCAGPVLYTVYASTMGQQIEQYPSTLLGYADDHCVYDCFKAGNIAAELATIDQLEACLDTVKSWMQMNRLKMNDSKTEVIYFGNQVQLDKCVSNSISVGQEVVDRSPCIKYLGAYLDSNLTMYIHIKNKCKIAAFNLYRIIKVRNMLTLDSCKVLVQALVISHLDYANGLFIGLPQKAFDQLQRIQNMAAKVTLRRSKYDSSTDALKTLHWLPIKQRVEFKILTIVFKCVHKQGPIYLSELINPKTSSYNIRTLSDDNYLFVPRTKCVTFGDRAFSVAGPQLWNKLPPHIRSLTDINIFRKRLKTYLFDKAF